MAEDNGNIVDYDIKFDITTRSISRGRGNIEVEQPF